jgi:hypothetical protein
VSERATWGTKLVGNNSGWTKIKVLSSSFLSWIWVCCGKRFASHDAANSLEGRAGVELFLNLEDIAQVSCPGY